MRVDGDNVRVLPAGELSDSEVQRSVRFYDEFREATDGAVKVGLYGTAVTKALGNPDALLVRYDVDGQTLHAPLLVPLDELTWFNQAFLQRSYGDETRFYCYAHPPIPRSAEAADVIRSAVESTLAAGAFVLADRCEGGEDPVALLALPDVRVERVGEGELDRQSSAFVGLVEFDGAAAEGGLSHYEAYYEGVKSGEFAGDENDGLVAAEKLVGEEADHVWDICDESFRDLEEGHPARSSFDKEGLLESLADPAVMKVLNRRAGEVTTLVMFIADFDYCPWFNRRYFEVRYPEYVATADVLICSAIVSDSRMRGASYSLGVLELGVKIMCRRQRNFVVTFECTEVSSRYIPRIVTRAVRRSGLGRVSGLERPVAVTDYVAIRAS